MTWRSADDGRALIATCVPRMSTSRIAETVNLILEAYGDKEVTRLAYGRFTTILQRPLAFHLGQAPLSLHHYRQIASQLPVALLSLAVPLTYLPS